MEHKNGRPFIICHYLLFYFLSYFPNFIIHSKGNKEKEITHNLAENDKYCIRIFFSPLHAVTYNSWSFPSIISIESVKNVKFLKLEKINAFQTIRIKKISIMWMTRRKGRNWEKEKYRGRPERKTRK